MFLISKNEAAEIRKEFPGVRIVRTMKQRSKRGRYWCDESYDAIAMLTKLRSGSGGWDPSHEVY